MSANKIICLGFQKTGTSSLSKALRHLGFRVGEAYSRINSHLDSECADQRRFIVDTAIDVLRSCDCIQDSPCPFIFRELDLAFPGSKFILTWRETDGWWRSFEGYFPKKASPLRKWMYGVSDTSREAETIKRIYDAQNSEIREYFKNRPGDFIEMNVTTGDGWLLLVTFLAGHYPLHFPHANRSNSKKIAKE